MSAKLLQVIDSPPWAHDATPYHWLLVTVAARQYFHRSSVTIKRWIKDGSLAERGIQSYWDGKRWFVRLPSTVTTERIGQFIQNERRPLSK